MTDKVSLHQYGNSFQAKLIASLLTNRQFLEQIQDILEPKFFESDSNNWLCKEIKKYFNKYKKLPTLDALKVIIDNDTEDILRVSIVEDLKNAFKHFEATDLDFVQEKALDFCKNQKIKDAIVVSVDLLQNGNYEEIKKLVDEALKAGTERDIGHVYMEQFEDRYLESARTTVKTPWEVVNDLTDGGLGPGELGVVVAPAGIGKSRIVCLSPGRCTRPSHDLPVDGKYTCAHQPRSGRCIPCRCQFPTPSQVRPWAISSRGVSRWISHCQSLQGNAASPG